MPGINVVCHKEFSKPPLSKKGKQKKLEEKRAAAEAKAAKRAKEEEEESARAEAEAARNPAEREAEIAQAREEEQRQADSRRLQNAQKKAVRACSSNDWVHALALYTECIEIDELDHLHWSNRAAVQNKLGRFEEMLEDASRCVELSPDFAKGWVRIGTANSALENYEAAEKGFHRALLLEPENTVAQEGLAAAKKALEEDAAEGAFDTLLRELKLLSVADLQARAVDEGIREDRVAEAASRKNAKEAMVSLVTAHRYIVDLVNEDLADLDVEGLHRRALQEGLDEAIVAEFSHRSSDDAAADLRLCIADFLAYDLVGAATDVLDEAEFEEVSDGDDDGTIEEELDFEVVACDGTGEVQLDVNDVFLEGAYIDEKYGELVLPNGIRLGHRSMHKYYKQRLRSQNDRQLVLGGARQKAMDLQKRVDAKIARRNGWKAENRIVGPANTMGNGAAASFAVRNQKKEAYNMKMWHNLHMWGCGGRGSHYWCAGSKQYIKGNSVKGVVLRHSRQGAKLQATRNKANRGTASHAILR